MSAPGKTLLKKKLSVKEKIEPFYLGGSVTYNSDGTHLFCQYRNHIKLLSVESGKQIGQFGSDDDEELSCFALSPNDEMLVSASRGLLMVLWDPKATTPTRSWKSAHQLPVEVMAFDSTSTLLASGGADGTVKVYDMVHSYCTHNLRIHKGVVKLVNFHPDTSRLQLFTSSGDFKIRIWNLQTSQVLAVLDKHFSLVTSMSFCESGDFLFSSSCDRVLVSWDLRTFSPSSVTALSEDIRSVLAIPTDSLAKTLDLPSSSSSSNTTPTSTSSDLALCVGSSGKIRIVDPVQSKILFSQKESIVGEYGGSDEDQVSSVVLGATHLRKSNAISVVSNFHHIFHFPLDDLTKPQKVFMGNNDEVLSLRLIDEGRLLAVVTNSPDIKIYQVESFSCRLLRGHTATVLSVDCCESRRLLASVSKDASARVWSYQDADNIVCVGIATGHDKSIINCAFSKLDGTFLVTGGEDMSLKCWRVSSKLGSSSSSADAPKKIKSIFTSAAAHAKDINSIALSPNDKFIASGSQDKTAKLWSREDGKLLGVFSGHRRGVWCVKFSSVDQIIATSSADGTLKLWALSDFSCIKSFDAHDASVLSVAFVSRGMQLISSGADGLVKLWTIKNSECSGSFDLHEAKIWALETASDGNRVVTGAADGRILFLDDVTEAEEIEIANKRDKKILQDQSLANCLHEKDFSKAFLLALDLDRPRDLLKICNRLLSLADWRPRLEAILARLRPEDQIEPLLSHLKVWNSNGRTCGVAQTLLELLLRVHDMDELVTEVPNIVGIVESLTPFTQRHYDRLQLLTQQTTFLDYLWNSMKLEALEEKNGAGKMTESTDDAEEEDKMEEDHERDSDSGVMEEEEESEGES